MEQAVSRDWAATLLKILPSRKGAVKKDGQARSGGAAVDRGDCGGGGSKEDEMALSTDKLCTETAPPGVQDAASRQGTKRGHAECAQEEEEDV